MHVSRKGEDIRKGDLILKKGTIVAPEQLSLLKSLGIEKSMLKTSKSFNYCNWR